MILLNLLLFIAAISVLVIGGAMIIKSLSKIAAFLHISEYAVGFIILAFATSLPELFVGISSAINKTPAIVLGDVIGANIADLTYVIGIPILLARGIKIHSKKTKKDSLWMIALAALPLMLMAIGNQISRTDGIILICAFLLYVRKLIKESRQFSKEIGNNISRKAMVASVFLFMIGLVLLYKSSDYVVKYASLLAIDFSVPPILIGLFMVAIGTSLPELVSGISAVLKGHDEMSVGNIIGTVIANSTAILGVSALIFPITANIFVFTASASFMILATILFTAFVEKGNRLSWFDGVSLVLMYIFFLIVEFYLRGFIK
jgi:cation:H+ antiporter